MLRPGDTSSLRPSPLGPAPRCEEAQARPPRGPSAPLAQLPHWCPGPRPELVSQVLPGGQTYEQKKDLSSRGVGPEPSEPEGKKAWAPPTTEVTGPILVQPSWLCEPGQLACPL